MLTGVAVFVGVTVMYSAQVDYSCVLALLWGLSGVVEKCSDAVLKKLHK